MSNHEKDCLCNTCVEADFQATLRENGLDPARYGSLPGVGSVASAPGSSRSAAPVRLASDKQLKFIQSLLRDRDTSGLPNLPVVEELSSRQASQLIDKLLSLPKVASASLATDRQVEMLQFLLSTRETPADFLPRPLKELPRAVASDLIDRLRSAPRLAELVTRPGVYRVDGVLYHVSRSVSNPSNYYAERIDSETGRRTFERGAIARIRDHHRVTLEEAQQFGRLTGVCCYCGRRLTDPQSIDAGVGPICAKRNE